MCGGTPASSLFIWGKCVEHVPSNCRPHSARRFCCPLAPCPPGQRGYGEDIQTPLRCDWCLGFKSLEARASFGLDVLCQFFAHPDPKPTLKKSRLRGRISSFFSNYQCLVRSSERSSSWCQVLNNAIIATGGLR